MEQSAVESPQVVPLPAHDAPTVDFDKGVLYGVAETFDGGCRLEEFALDCFSVGSISFDDASDLGVSCSIEECVYAFTFHRGR